MEHASQPLLTQSVFSFRAQMSCGLFLTLMSAHLFSYFVKQHLLLDIVSKRPDYYEIEML
jgi:hypothetical protein